MTDSSVWRRPIWALLLLLLVPALISEAQSPDKFDVARERTLGFDMRLGSIGPFHSSPYSIKSGLVWSRVVLHPSVVTSIRIHLRVVQARSVFPWQLVIKDLQGSEVEKIEGSSPLLAVGDYWSDEIKGRGARIEVWSDADPTGIDVLVDQYAYRTEVAFPQAVFGKDDRQPIAGAPPKVQSWAPPIARLRFMVSGSGQAMCTGFLVTENWLLTNEHCLRTSSELLSAVVEFGYDSYASSPDRFRADAYVVPPNSDLDYSLIRISGNAGAKWGKVTLKAAEDLTENQSVVIIQHPAGEPKQVSIVDCRVVGVHRQGRASTKTDFGHQCDTLGGSSGSPILDFTTGEVIGLHHIGFTEESPDPVNQGVYIFLILRDLQQRYPDVYRAIVQPGA